MAEPPGSRVVVLCLDTLGDLTLRQPLFRALLDSGRRVTVVARPEFVPFVPFLDPRLETLTVDIDPYRQPDERSRDLLRDARDRISALSPADLVSAPWDRTFVDEWLLGQLPRPARTGFARAARPRFVTKALEALDPPLTTEPLASPVACPEDVHEVDRNRALAESVCGRAVEVLEPELTLPEDLLREAVEPLQRMGLRPGTYAIGCLGGRTSLKAWPVDSYVGLLARLALRHGLEALVVGVEREAGLLRSVEEAASAAGIRVRTWIGAPAEMGVLLGLVRNSRLYVGGDTGPMHLAGALGVPVLARFGGGHWPRFLPRARRSFVATQDLPCFGCEWRCRIGHPACVTAVSDEILEAGLDWILGGDPDERRIDTGRALDPLALELFEGLLSTARAERVELEDVVFRLAAECRHVEELLQSTVPRSGLSYASPLRLVRMQRAVNRSLARLRGTRG